MIVHINSYPGVGKLTIGRALADLIGGKLLDNHSVFNVAFALTEFRSPAFYDTVRAVREIAYRRILELPRAVPVVADGKLTGLVSIGDVVKHRVEEIESESEAMRDYIRTA